MSIGRTFKESLQKVFDLLKLVGQVGDNDGKDYVAENINSKELRDKLVMPNSLRIFYIKLAIEKGFSIEELHELTGIDNWFIDQLMQLNELRQIGFDKSRFA